MTAGGIAVCLAGCTIFQSHQTPSQAYQTPSMPRATHAAPQQAPVTRRQRVNHSAPVVASKPAPPRPNLPQSPPPIPLITLGNSEDAKSHAQHLLDQATIRIAHVDQGHLDGGAAFTYQQANDLIDAAQRAMATQDYLAASSLAEKASALTDQLSPSK
jgi:hypothetical protein